MTTEWYRKPKARVSPRDSAYFDEMRKSGTHPAPNFGDLPEEVQCVITALEIDNMDLIQERYFRSAILWVGLGVVLLALTHFGSIARLTLDSPGKWDCVSGLALICFGGLQFVRSTRCAVQDIDDRFREDWEMRYAIGHKEIKPVKTRAKLIP